MVRRAKPEYIIFCISTKSLKTYFVISNVRKKHFIPEASGERHMRCGGVMVSFLGVFFVVLGGRKEARRDGGGGSGSNECGGGSGSGSVSNGGIGWYGSVRKVAVVVTNSGSGSDNNCKGWTFF